MPDIPVVTPAIIPEPSYQDVANFFASDPAPIVPEPKSETPEPKADEPVVDAPPVNAEAEPIAAEPVEEKITEAEPGTASTEQNEDPDAVAIPDEEAEPLPEGVVKRIAKEVERTSRIQRQIDTAVSARKAAAAELLRLKADTPGSEPAPITETPAKVEGTEAAEPVRPVLEGFDGDWDQFQAASKQFDIDYKAWLVAETTRNVTREVQQQLASHEQERLARQTWDEAVVTHGAEFPGLMDTVVAGSPKGFQEALSGLDNWSGVAMRLGQNPDELKSLVSTFKVNPFAAVAQLGRIEQQLESPATPATPAIPAKPAAKAPVKALPTPPAKVGGSAAASVPVDFNKADLRVVEAELKRLKVF